MLGCVRVVQDPTHLAKGVKVEWGPLAGPGCGLLPGQPRCPSTMIYAQRGGMDIMVPTTCGQKNTQIFGEILQVASWEGSYTAARTAASSQWMRPRRAIGATSASRGSST